MGFEREAMIQQGLQCMESAQMWERGRGSVLPRKRTVNIQPANKLQYISNTESYFLKENHEKILLFVLSPTCYGLKHRELGYFVVGLVGSE